MRVVTTYTCQSLNVLKNRLDYFCVNICRNILPDCKSCCWRCTCVILSPVEFSLHTTVSISQFTTLHLETNADRCFLRLPVNLIIYKFWDSAAHAPITLIMTQPQNNIQGEKNIYVSNESIKLSKCENWFILTLPEQDVSVWTKRGEKTSKFTYFVAEIPHSDDLIEST